MKKINFIIYIICITAIIGCKHKSDTFENNISNHLNICKLQTEDNNIIDNYIDSIIFLPIKEQSDHLFSTINKLIIHNDNIFILDYLGSHTLLEYDKNGEFVRQIGRQGQGPNEYKMLWDFDIDSMHIYTTGQNNFFSCII